MIGMGDSGKPDIAYTCPEQAAYFQALLDTLDLVKKPPLSPTASINAKT